MAEMRSNSNLAYKADIEKFEEYANRAERKPRIRSHVAKQTNAAAPSMVLGIIVMGAALTMLINAKADIAEIHTQIINQEAVVHSLENENVRMKAELETKSSMKAVEDYAENILGMQKLDKSQIEYVSLESGNVVEIPESNENIFASIKNAFENFVEYLKG
ncbi:MAG: hypothetical protein ACI4JJ_01375 [Huintestinicola sp.]